MDKYICPICGFVYDETLGIPNAGIAPETQWEDLPEGWVCPICAVPKSDFEKQQPKKKPASVLPDTEKGHDLRQLAPGELSALCSSLAKGCEKQNLPRETQLFQQLSDYFKSKISDEKAANIEVLQDLLGEDMEQNYPELEKTANDHADRGALRSFTWGSKVTRIVRAVLARYQKEGTGFLETSRVFLCDICGFIYIGSEKPEICPVCKVPALKIVEIERGA